MIIKIIIKSRWMKPPPMPPSRPRSQRIIRRIRSHNNIKNPLGGGLQGLPPGEKLTYYF
jgi:hypothetical protein